MCNLTTVVKSKALLLLNGFDCLAKQTYEKRLDMKYWPKNEGRHAAEAKFRVADSGLV